VSFLINYKVPEDLKAYSKKKFYLLYLEKQITHFSVICGGLRRKPMFVLQSDLLFVRVVVWGVFLNKGVQSSPHPTNLGILFSVSSTMQNCLM
jgi:hypothetical protein